jgi:hypothetical protein
MRSDEANCAGLSRGKARSAEWWSGALRSVARRRTALHRDEVSRGAETLRCGVPWRGAVRRVEERCVARRCGGRSWLIAPVSLDGGARGHTRPSWVARRHRGDA